MASRAAKATTPTLAPGNKLGHTLTSPRASRGFTLIELLVVVALIAIATAVASLALPNQAATQLERESARLVALFEGARAEARASGLAVRWAPLSMPGGSAADAQFRFEGLPERLAMPTRWLGDIAPAVEIVGARAVLLGPEPMIGAQRIVLRLADQALTLTTDGLGPFVINREAAQP
ncbi:MAG: prepilin-type N-terminal cleavage/methylation domain-containing protein [Burkholderiaceae bacterium]|nr:prepilin-type N-terminal cleavage/methylation domain-containing protein [Burkholderiaceae bacterium]